MVHANKIHKPNQALEEPIVDTNTKALTEYMTNVYRVESQIYEHQAMIDEFEKIIRECDSGTLSSSRNSLIGKYESSGSSYTKSKNK